jgi:hypothetical protein
MPSFLISKMELKSRTNPEGREIFLRELTEVLNEMWDRFESELMTRLVNSFPERMQICLNLGGRSIQSWVSSHRMVVYDWEQVNCYHQISGGAVLELGEELVLRGLDHIQR